MKTRCYVLVYFGTDSHKYEFPSVKEAKRFIKRAKDICVYSKPVFVLIKV